MSPQEPRAPSDVSRRERGSRFLEERANVAPIAVTLIVLVATVIWPAYEWPPNLPGPVLGLLGALIAALAFGWLVPLFATPSRASASHHDSATEKQESDVQPPPRQKLQRESAESRSLWLISLVATIGTFVLVAVDRGVLGFSAFIAPPSGASAPQFPLPPIVVLLAIVGMVGAVAVLARNWRVRGAAVGTGLVLLTITAENTVFPKFSLSFPIDIKWSTYNTPGPLPTPSGPKPSAPPQPPLRVYVGYADTLRAGGIGIPSPWERSPNVTFIGSGRYDAGALLFDNTSNGPITLDSITVYVGSVRFAIWSSNQHVPAGSKLILTQTREFNFDTSDQPATCTPTGDTPIVSWVIDGLQYSYLDTGRVLNDGGIDQGSCSNWNESHQWQLLTTAETPVTST